MQQENLRILAIDDNQDNLITLRAVVGDALPGATLLTALSGRDGIALARAADPQVILLDIIMPGMDGYAVCRALKSDERLCDIPVVFLTALRFDRERRIQALEAGADGFLTKPLDEIELTAQIRAMARIKAANVHARREQARLADLVAERTRALEDELSERVRAEQALREREQQAIRQNDVLLRLMLRGTLFRADLQAALAEITEACAELIGTERVSVWRYSEDHSVICCLDLYQRSAGQHSAGEVLHSADFPSYMHSHLRGEVIATTDVRTDPRTRQIPASYWDVYDIRSLVDAPVWLHGTMGGIVSFEQIGTPRVWSPDDERLCATMATLVSLCFEAAERSRTEAALRASEEQYRSLVENITDAIYILDLDGRFSFVSPVVERFSQYKVTDLLGRSFTDFIHPSDLPGLLDSFAQTMRGEIAPFEYRILDRDGAVRYIRSSSRLIYEGDAVAGIAGVMIDISERHRMVEALAIRARQQAVVAELGQVALSATDLQTLFDQAVARVAETFDVTYCKVLERLPDGCGLRLVAGVGWQKGLVGAAIVDAGLHSQAGFTLSAAEPVIVEDLRTETRFSGPLLLHDHGVVSGISVVIQGQDGPFGVLGAHATQRREFTPDDVHFFQAVANLLAAAIQRRQTDIALRESEERVRRLLEQQIAINQLALALGDSLNLDEVYHTIYQHIQHMMDVWYFIISSYDAQTELIRAEYAAADQVYDVAGFPPIPLGEPDKGTQSRVIHTGLPLYTPDHQLAVRESRVRFTIEDDGSVHQQLPSELDKANTTRSVVYLPMKVKGKTVGVMQVQSRRLDAYSPADIDLLAGMANVAAVAIQNARLHEDVLRELGKRKRVEDKLRRTLADLQRSNTDLERFAYVASHDLQEPLRMVASYVQLLGMRYQGQLDADADEFIGYAMDGARRMQQLILDLLEYSRVGTRSAPLEPTDTGAACRAAVGNLEVAIAAAGATVTCDALPTAPADGSQLTHVFQNLIANALKFRNAEPPRVHISARLISPEKSGGMGESENGEAGALAHSPTLPLARSWLFTVRDNGIGIDPQYFERIFVIFQRLHTREAYPGTGIGLAICKRIIERHGGRIWVESKPGQGAAFYFTLPA